MVEGDFKRSNVASFAPFLPPSPICNTFDHLVTRFDPGVPPSHHRPVEGGQVRPCYEIFLKNASNTFKTTRNIIKHSSHAWITYPYKTLPILHQNLVVLQVSQNSKLWRCHIIMHAIFTQLGNFMKSINNQLNILRLP